MPRGLEKQTPIRLRIFAMVHYDKQT